MDEHHDGIHHITVLSGEAAINADFYTRKLGLRFVAKSVNQDDPSTPHLFYGNATGSPGSELTFFPWPRAVQGSPGSGQAQTVSFAVPDRSLEFWDQRLEDEGIDRKGPDNRFGYRVIRFADPDGMSLEIVGDPDVDKLEGWQTDGISAENSIRGFWGSTLCLEKIEPTARVIEEVFGFESAGEDGPLHHYTTGAPIGGSLILEKTEPKRGENGKGIIHHIAFRAKDTETQREYRKKVVEMGLRPTDVIDRHFFKSVYFHEPGGVLFEIATDGPGFGAEDREKNLAEEWVLPPWYESRREMIVSRLPDV